MNKKIDRDRNYDFLRVICTIAVIMIHVSSSYKNAYSDINEFGKMYTNHLLMTCIYNLIPRFAVPCFVMLSGAFIMADNRNENCRFFYAKKVKQIGIPTLLFSFGYFVYTIITNCIGGYTTREAIKIALIHFVEGRPYYHIWYMYMMIGVYFLAPFIIKVKISISEKDFTKYAFIITIWTSLSSWTSNNMFEWDLCRSFAYIGYFMMGYIIRKQTQNKKNNFVAIYCVFVGIIIELIIAKIQYNHILIGINENDEKYALILPQTPWIVFASIIIFYGISMMDFKWNFEKLSSNTFYIYLFHAGVWDIMRRMIGRYQIYIGIFSIPVCIIVVFSISYLLTKLLYGLIHCHHTT